MKGSVMMILLQKVLCVIALVAWIPENGFGIDLSRAGSAIVTVHNEGGHTARAGFVLETVEKTADLNEIVDVNKNAQLPVRAARQYTGFRTGKNGLIVSILDAKARDSSLLQVEDASGRYDVKAVAWDNNSGLVALKKTKDSAPGNRATSLQISDDGITWGASVRILYQWRPGEPGIAAGLVSTVPRFDLQRGFESVELDLIVRPGAMGSPVLNSDGDVVGVVGQMKSTTGREGTGVAISYATLKRFLRYVDDGGEQQMPQAMLGISLTEENDRIKVRAVVPNSCAEKAGLQIDDLIESIDGKMIKSSEQMISTVRSHMPGDSITLRFVRDGEVEKVDVRLTQHETSDSQIVPKVTSVQPPVVIPLSAGIANMAPAPGQPEHGVLQIDTAKLLENTPITLRTPIAAPATRIYAVPQDVSQQLKMLSKQLNALADKVDKLLEQDESQ